MIVRSEKDALLFMEQEGVCAEGDPRDPSVEFCSAHCEYHGRHVASTSGLQEAPFAVGASAAAVEFAARLHGGSNQ